MVVLVVVLVAELVVVLVAVLVTVLVAVLVVVPVVELVVRPIIRISANIKELIFLAVIQELKRLKHIQAL